MAQWIDYDTGDVYEYDDGGLTTGYDDTYNDWTAGDVTDYFNSNDYGAIDSTGTATGGIDWSKLIGQAGSGLMSMMQSNPSLATTLGGALMGTMSGAKQTGTQTVTQAPWAGQQPYLTDLFSKAQTALGQTSATPSQYETQALGQMQSAAGGPTANPYFGQNNPYLAQAIDYANADTMRGLQPMFAQANRASGSFGNSGIAETFGRTAAEQMGRNATGMRMQDYTMQAGLGENAVNRTLGAAGDMYQFGQQQRLGAFDPLKQYGSLIMGNYGSQTNTPIYDNKWATALGGAITGAQVGGLLGSK